MSSAIRLPSACRAFHSQQQPVAPLVATLLLPKAAAARQPAATAAQQDGSSEQLEQVANTNTTPNNEQPCATVGSGEIVIEVGGGCRVD